MLYKLGELMGDGVGGFQQKAGTDRQMDWGMLQFFKLVFILSFRWLKRAL